MTAGCHGGLSTDHLLARLENERPLHIDEMTQLATSDTVRQRFGRGFGSKHEWSGSRRRDLDV